MDCDSYLINTTDCVLDEIPGECQCHFIQKVGECRLIARLPYLELPKCYLTGDLEPLAGAILAICAIWIFAALGLVVEYNIVPNLVTISKIFNLSDIVAGVTLLALGNGVTDIFTAVSSVYAAPDGGALAVSGLLGSAMFVFTVNSGLIAILHAPKVHLAVFTRDVVFYLVSLGWIGYMLSDKSLYAWQGLVFTAIYVAYIAYVISSDKRQRKWSPTMAESSTGAGHNDEIENMDPESALLLGLSPAGSPNASGRETPMTPTKQSYTVNPQIQNRQHDGTSGTATPVLPDVSSLLENTLNSGGSSADDDVSSIHSHFSIHSDTSRPRSNTPHLIRTNLAPPRKTSKTEWLRLMSFHDRSLFRKVLIVVQFPLRLVLFLSSPVLRVGDYTDKTGWDKIVVVLQTGVSIPLTLSIYLKELSVDEHASRGLPIGLYGVIVGVIVATSVAITSVPSSPPKYRAVFAFWGFAVGVTIVFALTDEMVGLMRDLGLWFSLSPSFVGLVVLGIGNGLNDLIANYIVAMKGWPHVAISAIYGGSILNVLIGMATCSAVGVFTYGDPYQVSFDEQNLLGLAASFAALIYVIISLAMKKHPMVISKRDGIVLVVLYTLFLIASVSVEILSHRTDVNLNW